MSGKTTERESIASRLRGEFWGLVGLIGDILVDWGVAMQRLSARKFWDAS